MGHDGKPVGWVFSAHAEVVPMRRAGLTPQQSILRARGGSSNGTIKEHPPLLYSPRTRR